MSTPARVQVSRTCCLSVHAEPGKPQKEQARPQLPPRFAHRRRHEGSWKPVAVISKNVPKLFLLSECSAWRVLATSCHVGMSARDGHCP